MNKKIEELLTKGVITKENIKTDSRQIVPGDVFIAVKGTSFDGHDYIAAALEKGARVVVSETIPSEVLRDRCVEVEDTRSALGDIAKQLYNKPSMELSVYGVTGTNGKTTTIFLIDSILSSAGVPNGLISTVFTKTEGETLSASSMTTPDCLSINRFLSEMVSSGKRAAAVEISSHALNQKRIWGLELDSAVFTNITPEHLDYHKDMDAYLRDKAKIFGYLKEEGIAILNMDDPMVASLIKEGLFARFATFGVENDALIKATEISLDPKGTRFKLVLAEKGEIDIKTKLIGLHNVYNVLAAVGALIYRNISLEVIARGIEKLSPPPGRLDMVDAKAPFRVFVDYAHTPNALENVLKTLKGLTDKRLICVFGCGGDRDRSKRPVMGKLSSELCDHVVLTSDNPRSEKPEQILDEIEKGIKGKTNYDVIPARRDAIFESLRMAKGGDVVLIAGKGHETYQIIGKDRFDFDDKKIAGEVLSNLGY